MIGSDPDPTTDEAKGGPASPVTWRYRHDLACEHLRDQESDEATRLFETNLGIETTDPRRAMTLESLASAHMALGRFDEALSRLRDALAVSVKIHGAAHRGWGTGKVRARTGPALLRQRKHAEAEPLLVGGFRELSDHAGQRPPWDADLHADLRRSIVDLYRATSRPDEAGVWEAQRERGLTRP